MCQFPKRRPASRFREGGNASDRLDSRPQPGVADTSAENVGYAMRLRMLMLTSSGYPKRQGRQAESAAWAATSLVLELRQALALFQHDFGGTRAVKLSLESFFSLP